MKKTIIALMALAGLAGAAVYDTSDFANTSSSLTLTDPYFQSGEDAVFEYTLDLNVANLVSTLVGTQESPITLTNSDGVILSYVESGGNVLSVALGRWGNDGLALQSARSVNYCDAKNVTSDELVIVKGDAYMAESDATNSLTKNNGKYNFADAAWWSDVTSATLTFRNEGSTSTSYTDYTAVLSVTKNGTVYDIETKCANNNVSMPTFGETTTVGINTHFVNSISIIPEPTTATLSLLALAGLAARRRRR